MYAIHPGMSWIRKLNYVSHRCQVYMKLQKDRKALFHFNIAGISDFQQAEPVLSPEENDL